MCIACDSKVLQFISFPPTAIFLKLTGFVASVAAFEHTRALLIPCDSNRMSAMYDLSCFLETDCLLLYASF